MSEVSSSSSSIASSDGSTLSITDESVTSNEPSLGSSVTVNTSASANSVSSESSVSSTPLTELLSRFGFTSFRPSQREVIEAALSGADVFCSMPSGYGKSLCYQLPGLIPRGGIIGTTFVISPHLSLIKDQFDSLQKLGVDARFINSDNSNNRGKERIVIAASYETPPPTFIFTTPESMVKSVYPSQALSALVKRNLLTRIVIDEAQCIGYGFRDFNNGNEIDINIRREFPGIQMLVFTSAITKREEDYVRSKLQINEDDVRDFSVALNQRNLSYRVCKKTKKVLREMANFIRSKHPGQTGLIFCHDKKECHYVQKGLNAYHQTFCVVYDPRSALRREIQNQWKRGGIKILVTTKAFGLGIDKKDVRFIIHYSPPDSMGDLYAQMGRAGHDGNPADCLLYYNQNDLERYNRAVDRKESTSSMTKEQQKLDFAAVMQYAENTNECRKIQLLRHFDQDFFEENCERNCDVCLNKVNAMAGQQLQGH